MISSTEEKASFPPATTQRMFSGRRFTLLAVVSVLVGAYAAIIAINWPFKEAALIEVLHKRSLRPVFIGRFHRTYFPPGCVAEGIRFLGIKDPSQPPLLTIQKLVLEDSYANLLLFQRRLTSVNIIGMHLVVPAKQPAGEPSPVMPLTYSDQSSQLRIGLISANSAVLDFEKLSAKPPLHLVVSKLSLYGVGGNSSVSYTTDILNSEPVGDIHSSGSWGPWNPSNPASTRVQGEYVYQNVHLSSLPGTTGLLLSRGRFNGTFGQMNVEGQANVANFKVNGASHARELHAEIHAVIDATKGDVFLKRIVASFDRTTLLFNGSVAGKQGEAGKTVDLTVTAGRARLEDLLRLFISSERAAMTGNIALQGHIIVPPGEEPFLEKLSVKGAFGVSAGLFSDKRTEQGLARLSVSAVKGDKEEDRENPQTVLSDIRGQVEANHGLARLTRLGFAVPGAHATLDGTFNLISLRSDLHGALVTTGNISDSTNGAKSFFLKALTPFFKRKKHVKVVPFKISGPFGHTTTALDFK